MLPKSYKPDGSFDLIRLGSDNDGGYLVDPKSIENSILDKIGEKSIKWESTGMFSDTPNRITYEEVIDGTRPVQTKKVLGVEVATRV